MTTPLQKAIAFLQSVGIICTPEPGIGGFLANCRLHKGTLLYDPLLCPASNALHEAGHLAIIPSETRHLASDNLREWERAGAARMEAMIDAGTHPDDPLIRAYMQTSDPEATAWAFAAGRAAGLDDTDIILDSEYDGEGAAIRLGLQCTAYIGINGLRHAGFLDNVRDFPKLTRWLQI